LYYRYGSFAPNVRLCANGERVPVLISPDGYPVPDLRTPFFNPPPWVQDPFPDPQGDTPQLVLKEGRYQVDRPLHFSNSGGVYMAKDMVNGKTVVIKEARPYTLVDRWGNDAPKLLEKEFRLLRKLRTTGVVPEAMDLFLDWEHTFLVEEYLEGLPLSKFAPIRGILLDNRPTRERTEARYHELLGIIRGLTRAVALIHEHGVLLGDLSPANVLWLGDEQVRIIDLEGVYEPGLDRPVILFTPGFRPVDSDKRSPPNPAEDCYSLGAIILSLLHPINGFLELKPEAAREFFEEICRDFGLPEGLRTVTLAWLDPRPERRPTPAEVYRELGNPQIFALKDPQFGQTLVDVPVPEEVGRIVERVANYLVASADYSRVDRLFPCPNYAPNPLSVDYGALGILYALHLMGREVPKSALDWVFSQRVDPQLYPPGLYPGLAGIAWVLAELGELERALEVWDMAYTHPLLFEAYEVYSGAAGCGLAALRLWRITARNDLLAQAAEIGRVLLKSAVATERGITWPSPDGAFYIGYAHGSSGIALFLLYLYLATGDNRFLDCGSRALQFDLSHAISIDEGVLSFPERADDTRFYEPYWEFGSAGVGTALLRYYAVTGREDLLDSLQGIMRDADRKYTLLPGLFMGLSGLGNFFLDCHQFLGDARHLETARRIAGAALLFRVERSEGIAFPGIRITYRPTADLGMGSAGVGLFLRRLLTLGPNFNFLPDELIPGRYQA